MTRARGWRRDARANERVRVNAASDNRFPIWSSEFHGESVTPAIKLLAKFVARIEWEFG